MKALDRKKTEIIDKFACFVSKRGLSVPFVLFMESIRPLRFISSQVLLFFEPFLNILVRDGNQIKLFREAMEEKEYFEYFICKVEDFEKKSDLRDNKASKE